MEHSKKGFTEDAARAVLNELDAMRQRIIALHPHIELDTSSRAGGLNPNLPGSVMDGDEASKAVDDSANRAHVTPRASLNKRLNPIPNLRPFTPEPSLGGLHSDELQGMSAHKVRELVRKELLAEVRSRNASAASSRPTTQEISESLSKSETEIAAARRDSADRAVTRIEPLGPLRPTAEEHAGAASPYAGIDRGEESQRKDRVVHKPEQHNFMELLHLAPNKNKASQGRRESEGTVSDVFNNPAQVLTEDQMRAQQAREDAWEAEEKLWLQQAENAYGAFIHVALKDNIWKALAKCGPMLLASILVQAIFSFRLFQYLPDVRNICTKQALCAIPSDLQLSAVGVFITLMLNNVPSMFRAATISIKCAHRRNNLEPSKTNVVEIKISKLTRFAVFCLAVLTEFLTWSAIMTTGVLFILTSQTVELLIRSTVAIMFVQVASYFTLKLGVAWSRIAYDGNETSPAACRTWTRWCLRRAALRTSKKKSSISGSSFSLASSPVLLLPPRSRCAEKALLVVQVQGALVVCGET